MSFKDELYLEHAYAKALKAGLPITDKVRTNMSFKDELYLEHAYAKALKAGLPITDKENLRRINDES